MDRPFWMSTANRGASLVSRPTTLAQAPQASPRSAAPASVPHSVNCIHQQRTCQDQGARLRACVTLPSIDSDSCLPLKILRRHSIGNKERRAEQSSCLCRHTRTTIDYIWNVLVSRLAALIGASTASFKAAGFGNATRSLIGGMQLLVKTWHLGSLQMGTPHLDIHFRLVRCRSRPVAVVQGEDAMSLARM